MDQDVRSACTRRARAIARDCGLSPLQALRPRSALNNNNNPFQIALRCTRKQTARIVVDPFACDPDLQRRADAAERFARSRVSPLGPAALAAVDEFLEVTSLPVEATPHGQLWVALDAEEARVELYRPLSHASEERGRVLPRLAEHLRVGACARFVSEASAVSLSVSASAEHVLSVYHRPRDAASGVFQLADKPSYLAFLTILDPHRPLSRRGLLVASTHDSLGCTSVKIDLCAHCLAFSDAAWTQRFVELSRHLGLQLPAPTPRPAISFIGLSDGQRGPAVVVYYRPDFSEPRSSADAAMSILP